MKPDKKPRFTVVGDAVITENHSGLICRVVKNKNGFALTIIAHGTYDPQRVDAARKRMLSWYVHSTKVPQ